jgi:hypothetical protein
VIQEKNFELSGHPISVVESRLVWKSRPWRQIPRFYALGATRSLRFRLSDFENAGLFDRRLEWMIEAALK